MTDREKLIVLLKANLPHFSNDLAYWQDEHIGELADHLLAHCVTIREPGEWETDKEDIEWGNALKRKHCTKCGKRPHFDKEKREFVLSDFCPHCGAPMKGESK